MSINFKKLITSLLLICNTIIISGCIGTRMNMAQGILSFQRQDYRQAFIHLMPAARAGNPDAQYAIGYMYYYGEGVLENRKKAWYWIALAAKAGQADAVAAMQVVPPPPP